MPIPTSAKIHPTAIIDPEAIIGEEVEVGPYSVIGANVSIGARSRIASHAVIEGYTTLGEKTRVFQFASVGSQPQDLKFHGEKSTLVMGDGNIIREYVTIQPGTTNGLMTTIVGDNNLFMACAHVGHDCVVGSRNVFANQAALAGHVTVKDNVILGGMVGIHQFVKIGSFAMISGGAMVSLDVPPYCVAQGDRAALRGVNTIGLQRAGFEKEKIAEIKRLYRALFSTQGRLKEKRAELSSEFSNKSHVALLLSFLDESDRGVCSPSSRSDSSSEE